MHQQPSYISLLESGELRERARKAREMLSPCRLCPRACETDRRGGETGYCKVGKNAVVASFGPHFGEEPPLVGLHGSGTVFFAGCNLGCVFCQNYDISHFAHGTEVGAAQLAGIFMQIQSMGCHNLNLVTPTHVLSQILAALEEAARQGLTIPIVYNSGGYDPPDALEILDGIVDIYMPDMKSFSPQFCCDYLHAEDYPEVVREAVARMAAQVGDVQLNKDGILRRGLLLRHLVMPEGEEDSIAILDFLHKEIPQRILLNVMDQYRPCYRAEEFLPLSRRTPSSTYQRVRKYAEELGFEVC